jgi:DNA-binding NarL/FixJ family response regulator
MKRTKVVIADDHRLVAESLRGLLEPEFEVVALVEDGRELIEADRRFKPDVILADVTMPFLNGIEAIRELREVGSRAAVILLTMHHDATYARRGLEAGASGFLLKHSGPSELITAIREVLKGRTYVTPIIVGDLLTPSKHTSTVAAETSRNLTERRSEILRLLAEGHSAKEVAYKLHISSRTVECHKYAMMKDLNIRTTTDLVRYAIRQGMIA